MQERWNQVDAYFEGLFTASDPIMNEVLNASDNALLPPINVSPTQGKLLTVMALAVGTKRILEIGTLGGYSTIWLARALPKDGKLITLEYEPKHATVAKTNVKRAGFDDMVDIRIGDAVNILPELAQEEQEPFDLIFIDADKTNNVTYFRWALELSRIGSMIIVDNVVRDGQVVNPASTDDRVLGTQEFLTLFANESRITTTAIQTVGNKGYDGFAIGVVQS